MIEKDKSILFFFSVGIIGGAETNFIKIARELYERGYTVFIAVVKNNGPLFDLIDPFVKGKIVVDFTDPRAFFTSISAYCKFLRVHKIDTVLNFGLKVEIFSRLFSKFFGANFVISNIRSTDDWRKWYHIAIDRLTSFTVDLWIANSEAGKKAFVAREKINPDNCLVIYNFVGDEIPELVPKTIAEPLSIGILSNIKEGKGFEDLIKLAKLLIANQFKFKFVIAGRDLMNGSFQQTIKNEDLDLYFNFIGYIENKDTFFQNIDLLLLPTYVEGLPTSLLEAMERGVPIVSTYVGGIPEMITHQYNGYLCRPGAIDEYEKGIMQIYKNNDIFDKYRINSHQVLREKFIKLKVMDNWIKVLFDE